jgi:hypothetical protein
LWSQDDPNRAQRRKIGLPELPVQDGGPGVLALPLCCPAVVEQHLGSTSGWHPRSGPALDAQAPNNLRRFYT